MTIFDKLLPPTPVLETGRLVLRPLAPDDAPTLQRRFPRWEIVRRLSTRVPWPYPPDGAARYIVLAQEEMARGEKHHWTLRLKGGPDELIGCIDLWPDDGASREMRGFWLDPEFQGRGLMTANRVTDYAFRDLGWPHLWVGTPRPTMPRRASRNGRARGWSSSRLPASSRARAGAWSG